MTTLTMKCYVYIRKKMLLVKQCIKFIWNLFNSSHELHKSIIRGSFYNKGSSITETIRYFMYKYSMSMKRYLIMIAYIRMSILFVLQQPL